MLTPKQEAGKAISPLSKYTAAIADTICQRLINGESLRAICAGPDMPNAATVCRWLAAHEAFREQYARAREAQADTLADEILDIADDSRNDYMKRRLKDGSIEEVLDTEHIQRSRLRVDSRKWLASKMAPKKYGDKLDIDANVKVGILPSVVDDYL